MRRTRLFHSVVIVGSGLLTGCKGGEHAAPAAGSSAATSQTTAGAAPADAATPDAADAALDAAAPDAAVPVDAAIPIDAARPHAPKPKPKMPAKLEKPPKYMQIQIYEGD